MSKITRRFQPSFFGLITVGGFIFLYLPLVLLVIYSFNESKLVTVWKAFSTKWYFELLNDDQILQAAWISLKVAFTSACIATVVGGLSAYSLTRLPKFRGKLLLSGMISAPLVIPEVVLGLSALLLFVSLDSLIGYPDGRGVLTIIIAHATFSAAFVALIVQSSLVEDNIVIEEAAQDLGASPLKSLFLVVIPIHLPALISGWLLAFTLSLDDLVIASFVSGPGSSTLPMVIFSRVRLGVSPVINSLATIILIIVSIAVIFLGILMKRRLQSRR